MKRDLLIVFLTAVILALMVPLSVYALRSEKAFTYDNLIFVHTAASSQQDISF